MTETTNLQDILADVGAHCQVTRARKRARALTRSYNEALSVTGLRSTEYAVLIAVGRLGEGRMHEIAEGLGMELSTLTRSVASLEKKGLLRVQIEGHRTRRVLLTDAGGAKVVAGYAGWQRAQNAVSHSEEATR